MERNGRDVMCWSVGGWWNLVPLGLGDPMTFSSDRRGLDGLVLANPDV